MHLPHRRHRTHRPSRPRAGLLAAALALAVASAAGAAGVSSAADGAAARPAAAAPPVVTIATTTTGTSLTAGSAGLSFEASDLALPGFTSGNLASYLRTLGTSVLRIGGNTVDQTYWTSSGETPPSWSIATITPAELTRWAPSPRASGWKVILGVNLKHYDPARAGDEAAHAAAALGSSLQAVEIGNEPDLYPQYSGNTAQYLTDFAAYVAAVNRAARACPIVGTDAAGSPGGSFQNAFVAAQAALSHPTSPSSPATTTR